MDGKDNQYGEGRRARTNNSLRDLIDGGVGRTLREPGTTSRTLSEFASGHRRLADLTAGLDKSATSRTVADVKQSAAFLSRVDGLGVNLLGAGHALEAMSGMSSATRLHRELGRSLAAMGSIEGMTNRHSAMGSAIDALGGIGSVLSRHERAFESLGLARMGPTSAQFITNSVLSSASFKIDRALRDLAGVTAFTGLIEGGLLGKSRYEAMIDGTMAWRESTKRLTLQASLHAQLPDLFSSRRRAQWSDFGELHLSGLGERFMRKGRLRTLQEEMVRLRQPWVDSDQPHRSVSAYIEARALCGVVEQSPAESRTVVTAVRAELGDYRETEPISEVIVADPVLRSAFRLEVGYNPDLSSLPPAILATIFGPIDRRAMRNIEVDPDALESVVHQRVRRLELRLRRFIDRRMIVVSGPKWSKQRVDGETVKKWRARRQIDLDNGRRPGPLIDYAGFEDYRAIIDRTDNWKDVFSAVFPVRTSILETLRRLSLIRNPDAHFRVVTIEDFLDLVVEGRRLDQWLDATG
ncbi:MAG: hypothetical protein WKF52_06380 [Sphingomicrobium sp.]